MPHKPSDAPAASDHQAPATNSLRRLRQLSTFQRIKPIESGLLLLCVAAQLMTIFITWPLWQVRNGIPNLPTFDLPPLSFGWLMIASAAAVVIRPKPGVIFHWAVLIMASVFDQFRLQPQFFLIALLMSACINDRCRKATRWILVSTWIWAGLHKLISPDWPGHVTHWMLGRTPLEPEFWSAPFAYGIAFSELALGCIACFRPRLAAWPCVAVHCGIAIFLIVVQWNYSVIPWNLATAICGFWILKQSPPQWSTSKVELAFACGCLIYPIAFYVGWVDHGFAGVLYSDSVPRGMITTRQGVHPIGGWGDLAVPFPNERRTLRIYFEQYSQPGDKLHVCEPRRLLDDQFFVLGADGHAHAIDAETFFFPQMAGGLRQSLNTEGVAGIAVESKRSLFELSKAGVRMLRQAEDQPIYAVAFTAMNYDRKLLKQLSGIPNLMQVQLSETSVEDADLSSLSSLVLLTGLGLNETDITDDGLKSLKGLKFLQSIEHDGTQISDDAVNALLAK